MKRHITPTPAFTRELHDLLKKRKVSENDVEEFKKKLVENPDQGDPISGTGGVRKTRLKSISKGKRGGFRVCYYDDCEREELFLILIYAKNEKEDLTQEEKKALKEFTKIIKSGW
jgi:mRNA-degrading endonuclease RelE of RelBE toxin-antitoxin system